jgi:hypothetical protein
MNSPLTNRVRSLTECLNLLQISSFSVLARIFLAISGWLISLSPWWDETSLAWQGEIGTEVRRANKQNCPSPRQASESSVENERKKSCSESFRFLLCSVRFRICGIPYENGRVFFPSVSVGSRFHPDLTRIYFVFIPFSIYVRYV